MPETELTAMQCKYCGGSHFTETQNELILECQFCGGQFILEQKTNLPAELFALNYGDERKNNLLHRLRYFIEHREFERAYKALEELKYNFPGDYNVLFSEHALAVEKKLAELQEHGYQAWKNPVYAEKFFSIIEEARDFGVDTKALDNEIEKVYTSISVGTPNDWEDWKNWLVLPNGMNISANSCLRKINEKVIILHQITVLTQETEKLYQEISNKKAEAVQEHKKILHAIECEQQPKYGNVTKVEIFLITAFSYLIGFSILGLAVLSIFLSLHFNKIISVIFSVLLSGFIMYLYYDISKCMRKAQREKNLQNEKKRYTHCMQEIEREYSPKIQSIEQEIDNLNRQLQFQENQIELP